MIPKHKQTPKSLRFFNFLRMKRQQLGLTLKDVARLLELQTISHLSEYERGIKTPSLLRLIDLAIILHEPRLDELFPDLYAHRYKQIAARRMSLDHNQPSQSL